jgi:hypothetical protein
LQKQTFLGIVYLILLFLKALPILSAPLSRPTTVTEVSKPAALPKKKVASEKKVEGSSKVMNSFKAPPQDQPVSFKFTDDAAMDLIRSTLEGSDLNLNEMVDSNWKTRLAGINNPFLDSIFLNSKIFSHAII